MPVISSTGREVNNRLENGPMVLQSSARMLRALPFLSLSMIPSWIFVKDIEAFSRTQLISRRIFRCIKIMIIHLEQGGGWRGGGG